MLAGLYGLSDDRQGIYPEFVYDTLCEAARKELEALMTAGTFEYKMPFARRFYSRGLTDGEARGEARGEAKSRLLAARGLAVDEATRERVLATSDTGQLEKWFDLAVTARSSDEVFG